MRAEAVLRYAEYRKKSSGYLLLLVAPFIAVILAMRNYKYSWSKNLVWFFVVFYGYTFVFSGLGLDSDRYVKNLEFFSKQQNVGFSEFTILLYAQDTNYVDVLQPLLTFAISRFTSDGRILFACFGLIFGYFYSRNIWFLLSKVEGKIRREAIPFLILFVFVVAIWQINGFRFYTAAHIFIYGLFQLLDGKRNRGFLFCISSLFVHFSFALPLVIVLIHFVIGNRLWVSFLLYLASFFISQVSPESLRTYSDLMPAFLQERSERYTSSEYVEEREKLRKRGKWFLEGRVTYLTYTTTVLLFIIFLRFFQTLKENYVAAGLVTVGLLLFALSNFLSQVPSVGARFQLISMLILYGGLFLVTQESMKPFFSKMVLVPFILTVVLFVVVEIRIGFSTVGVLTILGNPLVAPFVDSDVALINLFQ